MDADFPGRISWRLPHCPGRALLESHGHASDAVPGLLAAPIAARLLTDSTATVSATALAVGYSSESRLQSGVQEVNGRCAGGVAPEIRSSRQVIATPPGGQAVVEKDPGAWMRLGGPSTASGNGLLRVALFAAAAAPISAITNAPLDAVCRVRTVRRVPQNRPDPARVALCWQ